MICTLIWKESKIKYEILNQMWVVVVLRKWRMHEVAALLLLLWVKEDYVMTSGYFYGKV